MEKGHLVLYAVCFYVARTRAQDQQRQHGMQQLPPLPEVDPLNDGIFVRSVTLPDIDVVDDEVINNGVGGGRNAEAGGRPGGRQKLTNRQRLIMYDFRPAFPPYTKESLEGLLLFPKKNDEEEDGVTIQEEDRSAGESPVDDGHSSDEEQQEVEGKLCAQEEEGGGRARNETIVPDTDDGQPSSEGQVPESEMSPPMPSSSSGTIDGVAEERSTELLGDTQHLVVVEEEDGGTEKKEEEERPSTTEQETFETKIDTLVVEGETIDASDTNVGLDGEAIEVSDEQAVPPSSGEEVSQDTKDSSGEVDGTEDDYGEETQADTNRGNSEQILTALDSTPEEEEAREAKQEQGGSFKLSSSSSPQQTSNNATVDQSSTVKKKATLPLEEGAPVDTPEAGDKTPVASKDNTAHIIDADADVVDSMPDERGELDEPLLKEMPTATEFDLEDDTVNDGYGSTKEEGADGKKPDSEPSSEENTHPGEKIVDIDNDDRPEEKITIQYDDKIPQTASTSSQSSSANNNNNKEANRQFVDGLDKIDKLFESVEVPDELDVGADGSSMQDVLVGQGLKIAWTRTGNFRADVRGRFEKVVGGIKGVLRLLDIGGEEDEEGEMNVGDLMLDLDLGRLKQETAGGGDHWPLDETEESEDEKDLMMQTKQQKKGNNVIGHAGSGAGKKSKDGNKDKVKESKKKKEEPSSFPLMKSQKAQRIRKFARRKWEQAKHMLEGLFSIFDGADDDDDDDYFDLDKMQQLGKNKAALGDDTEMALKGGALSMLNFNGKFGSEVDESFLKTRYEAMMKQQQKKSDNEHQQEKDGKKVP